MKANRATGGGGPRGGTKDRPAVNLLLQKERMHLLSVGRTVRITSV